MFSNYAVLIIELLLKSKLNKESDEHSNKVIHKLIKNTFILKAALRFEYIKPQLFRSTLRKPTI